MKLLFQKQGVNASTELKELLGFIDADVKFDNIKPDVLTATNEQIRLIGQPLYNSVLDAYLSENPTETDLEIINIIRYPIAIRAYMHFAPSNDIAHTANGRKMRQDDKEKQAFEWMIDRDNEALERRYYRALDDMLVYLDRSSQLWKTSEAYKNSHRLFLRTADDFDEYFRVDSRLLLLKLEPGIRQCELNEILPRIGAEKFNLLKQTVQSGGQAEASVAQLLALVKEACVYHAMAWAMPRLSVNLFPEGVLQKYTSDRSTNQIKRPAAGMEVDAAKMAFANDAALVLTKIEQLVAVPQTPDPCSSKSPEIITGNNFISL